MEFQDPSALAKLQSMAPEELDDLPFGVIGVDEDGVVDAYNAYESRLSGLTPASVLGQNLFFEVAPCLNNFMVAQRMYDERELDDVVPYVLTVRLRPTPVQLRLLKKPGHARMYLMVRPEGTP